MFLALSSAGNNLSFKGSNGFGTGNNGFGIWKTIYELVLYAQAMIIHHLLLYSAYL